MNYDPNLAASITATGRAITIPLIRSFTPGIMAQQIAGVQPMTGTGKSWLSQYYYIFQRSYSKKYWPYQYSVEWNAVEDAERWCWKQFKGRHWHSNGPVFVFKRRKDAALFVLKWL